METIGVENPVIAYIGLGSSVGDRSANLAAALERMQAEGSGIKILAVSSIYQTPHMGLEPGDEAKYPPHLNCVAKIAVTLSPEQLLGHIRIVEEKGGRQRTQRWGPRTIDLDILVYDSRVQQTSELTLPHPGIAERAFVVVPFAEIAPDLILPDGRALAGLLNSEAIRSQPIARYEPDHSNASP